MQNAVVLVQSSLPNFEYYLNYYYAAEWNVRIGNSPVYSENPLCPGGPFLKRSYDDYVD
jgi:hypothetical protein